VSGAEEQLGGPGRVACAQLQLQRGMYVRCTNTHHRSSEKIQLKYVCELLNYVDPVELIFTHVICTF
jgi:hypothetical protein